MGRSTKQNLFGMFTCESEQPIISAPRKGRQIKFIRNNNKTKKQSVPQLVDEKDFVFETPIKLDRQIDYPFFSEISDISNFNFGNLNICKTPEEYK